MNRLIIGHSLRRLNTYNIAVKIKKHFVLNKLIKFGQKFWAIFLQDYRNSQKIIQTYEHYPLGVKCNFVTFEIQNNY